MSDYNLWLIITIVGAVVIGVAYALLKRFLQDRDAKRQLEGKEPFREMKEGANPQSDDKILNNDFEIEKDRMRSQNMPHV